jgi:hypothetical protein
MTAVFGTKLWYGTPSSKGGSQKMNTRKSLESLTLELSEINEKQARIIQTLVNLLLQFMSQEEITRILNEEDLKHGKSV